MRGFAVIALDHPKNCVNVVLYDRATKRGEWPINEQAA